MTKSTTERVTTIDEKIEQLKQQKKAILAREKEKERKARTRRLIQKGAIVEKYAPELSEDELAKRLLLASNVMGLFAEQDTNNYSPEEITQFLQKNISTSLYLEKKLQRSIVQKDLDACIAFLNQSQKSPI